MKACCVKRRGKEVAPWLLPSGLLILMPKCPVCFAAYIAAGTGLGLSLPTATGLRIADRPLPAVLGFPRCPPLVPQEASI